MGSVELCRRALNEEKIALVSLRGNSPGHEHLVSTLSYAFSPPSFTFEQSPQNRRPCRTESISYYRLEPGAGVLAETRVNGEYCVENGVDEVDMFACGREIARGGGIRSGVQ
jgi:hypothetical protein